MTGTPAGVAALSPGDKIECGVDGVGTLNSCDRQAGITVTRSTNLTVVGRIGRPTRSSTQGGCHNEAEHHGGQGIFERV